MMQRRFWCYRLCATLVIAGLCGCQGSSGDAPGERTEDGAQSAAPTDEITQNISHSADPELEGKVQAFCGDCHVMPRPESFPKAAWYDEVRRGFDFYFAAHRLDLSPPPQADVVEYFRSRAPERLPVAAWEEAGESPLHFAAEHIAWNPLASRQPAVSFLELSSADSDSPQVLVSDMKAGHIGLASIDGDVEWSLTDVARHPCAVRAADIDGNGVDDLLVTDLGSFLPEDHDHGKLLWLIDGAAGHQPPVTLLEGVGRVSDVRSGDFDADDDLDLVVGVFGWHATGGIHLLTQEQDENGRPRFTNTIIDERPGTIQLPTIDLNQDGRLDFIALISQEFETVTAFINEGSGEFRKEPLFNAPDPAYGSSGIELTDLDLDGDVDILYTNGDTFDSFEVKPFHGISWLENQGDLQFVEHRLTIMPGVHRALAVDLDGDGDNDIAAVALLPSRAVGQPEQDIEDFDSVIWLEQTDPGKFVRHSIERGRPQHATLAIGDLDDDGDPDLLAGMFLDAPGDDPHMATVFLNHSMDGAAPLHAAEGAE